MKYLIKEAAEKLNVSIHTLRYYDKEGLTPFIKKDENGVRKYTEEDLEWIRLLISIRDIDMPISNIREYINLFLQGDKTIEQRRELMIRYRDYVRKKVQGIMSNLELASKKLCQYDEAIADLIDDEDLLNLK